MARYIDADVCLDAMLDEMVGTGYQSRAMDVIKFTPTADVVEVKHGYWIPVPSSDMSTGKAYKCSECKIMRYGCRLPPYCQECGAKMDSERKCE